jgi:hypothetical protein
MKNTLGDLNNHLFAELERLNDEELQGEELTAEISRAHAVQSVAGAIIANAKTVLNAQKFQDEKLSTGEIPRMLSDGE